MKTYTITGMTCEHCKNAVEKAANAVNGITKATADLGGTLVVQGDHDVKKLIDAIENAGYGAKEA